MNPPGVSGTPRKGRSPLLRFCRAVTPPGVSGTPRKGKVMRLYRDMDPPVGMGCAFEEVEGRACKA